MNLAHDFLEKIEELDVDDVLRYLGLEKRRATASTVLTLLSVMLGGVVVGVGIGVLFAPAPGEETREKLLQRFKDLRSKMASREEDEEEDDAEHERASGGQGPSNGRSASPANGRSAGAGR